MAHVAFDSQERVARHRRAIQSRLNQAAYDGRRLAALRRFVGGALVALGAPVAVFSRSDDPRIRHALAVLSIVWLMFALPLFRLLFSEWHNRRLITELRAMVHVPRESGRPAGPFRA
jgi:hypothetical protein